MKLLYISIGLPDYQCDCLLHGFYNLLGENLTHTDDYHLMYKEFTNTEQLLNSYGKGFTIWGNLSKYFNDKTDIENKIKNKYFDFIVYGSIRRCRDHIDLVLEHYPRNKIAFVDGEDDSILINTGGVPLFKRELVIDNVFNIFPISFSIPEEKIVKEASEIKKERFLAEYLPGNGNSYIYNKEQEYYQNYQKAFFGRTHKKGGWDCMRHYEILANFCLPHFPDLENCPPKTMSNFPKQQILEGNKLFEKEIINDKYYEILNDVFEFTKTNLTTKISAKYIIDTLYSI